MQRPHLCLTSYINVLSQERQCKVTTICYVIVSQPVSVDVNKLMVSPLISQGRVETIDFYVRAVIFFNR